MGSAWLLKFSDDLLGRRPSRRLLQRLSDWWDSDDKRKRNRVLKYLEEPETSFDADEMLEPMPKVECSVEEHIRKRLVGILEGPMQLFSDSDGIFQSHQPATLGSVLAYFSTRPEPKSVQTSQDTSSFSDIWNMLAWRSTSEEKDVPGIFANLLNFNLYQLAQHFPDEQMLMGLLWNLQGVPLTLLFNKGPRLMPGKNHRNRWVPIKRHAISCDKGASMVIKGTNFHFTDEIRGQRSLVMFIWPRDGTSHEFIVQGPKGPVHVNLFRTVDDEMSMEVGAQYTILIDGNFGSTEMDLEEYSGTIQGAILRVCEHIPVHHEDTDERRKGFPRRGDRISATYDCPVELSLYGTLPAPESVPVVETAEILEGYADWEVFLQAGLSQLSTVLTYSELIFNTDSSPSKSRSLDRRVDFANSEIINDVMAGAFQILYIANAAVRITIAVRLGWRTLQPLGRAALILWVLQMGVALPVPPGLAKILFIVDRTRNGGLTALDWAYIFIVHDIWLCIMSVSIADLLDAHVGWRLNMFFYSENFVNPKGLGDWLKRSIILLALKPKKKYIYVKWLEKLKSLITRYLDSVL